MGTFAYIVALLLAISWGISFFIFEGGAITHLLLLIAAAVLLTKNIQARRNV